VKERVAMQPTPEIAPGATANADIGTGTAAGSSMHTAGHTIGPFFHDALAWAGGSGAAEHAALGTVRIEGTVEDGSGERLPAWLLEAWVPQSVQAEAAAGLPAPGFRRLMNDEGGRFCFFVPPPPPGEPAAYVTLFGLGLTRHQFSAVFLDDGTPADACPLLQQVPAERRATLVAERLGEGHYRWTIRTQGARETVFLEYR
jgi:protocatechuate 3,4-dioxygenase alpha subunit